MQYNTSADDIRKQALAEKLLIIHQALAGKYHIVNMTNPDRWKNVLQYLNT